MSKHLQCKVLMNNIQGMTSDTQTEGWQCQKVYLVCYYLTNPYTKVITSYYNIQGQAQTSSHTQVCHMSVSKCLVSFNS